MALGTSGTVPQLYYHLLQEPTSAATFTVPTDLGGGIPGAPAALSSASVEFLRRAFAREYELREVLVRRLRLQHHRTAQTNGTNK